MKEHSRVVVIHGPVIERLSRLYTVLCRFSGTEEGKNRLSSTDLGRLLGEEPHTVRKDLSIMKNLRDGGEAGRRLAEAGSERGYDAGRLKEALRVGLGLDKPRTACLVGLGSLGSAILHRMTEEDGAYTLAAAFDSSVNRLELIETSVPLFHSREIVQVVKRKCIDLGIIAVPVAAAQDTANRLISGGVRGIVNFAPIALSPGATGVFIRNVSLAGELHALSAHLFLQGE